MEQDQSQHRGQSENTEGSQPFTQVAEPESGQEVPLKQSGLGVASFIIGIVSIIAVIGCAIAATAGISEFISANGALEIEDPESLQMNSAIIISGLLILVSLGLSFIGFILGVIGLFMKRRRKVFGIIGVILNGLLVFGFGALIVAGIALQFSGA
ncbi:hypothetical protein AB6A23_07685 [Paenibacillus tarimensis]